MAEVLALAEYRDTLCPDCGLPRDQVNGHERNAPQFIVSRHWCWASKTLAESQDVWMRSRADKRTGKVPVGDVAARWTVRIKEG